LGFYTFSRRGHFFFAECPQTNTSSLRRKGSMKCSTHLPCHLDLVIVRWHQCALCRPYPSPFITLIYNIKICTATWLLLHISQMTLTLTARPLPPCSPWLRCDAISHAQPRPAQLPPHRLGPLPELVRPSVGSTILRSSFSAVAFVATARKIGAVAAITMPAPANQKLDQYKIPTLLD
jgi:hypothetical protein